MIAVLAGGVGAARLLTGLTSVVEPSDVLAVVNTGDDAEMHGLHVSPDLDTVTYTLAGAGNAETGWGLAGESWTVMAALERYGGPTWFRLGDRDLATHLYRTGRLAAGATLSDVTCEIVAAWGVRTRLVPMSDEPVRTCVGLASGERVDFQDYFVRLRHDVAVEALWYEGAEAARPAPGVIEALEAAELVLVAPSNPLLSIAPILAVPGIAAALERRRESVVAISPIVAGAALKGPADRLLVELGHEASPAGVARLLAAASGTLVIDNADGELAPAVRAAGMRCVVTDTVMADPQRAVALARTALAAGRAAAR